MPPSFSFTAPVPLAFGDNRLTRLGRDVGRLAGDGAEVLLVVDPVHTGNGLAERAACALDEVGHGCSVFSDIASDPAAETVDAISEQARSRRAACIVAMGGGSTLDAAKLASCLAPDGRDAVTFALGGTPVPAGGLPKIAVPTTAGTGSEVTRTSVFSTGERKLWAWGESLRFDLALLDPLLTVTLPAPLTAATGIDAMVHAIESATCRRRNPVSSAMALGAIRTLRAWLPEAVRNPACSEARGHVQIAAALAGIAFDVTGVAVAHAIGHALGHHAGLHHGRAVGLALAATMEHSAEAAADAYSAVAAALGGPEGAAALQAPSLYRRFLADSGFDLALEGLGERDVRAITSLCFEPENLVMLRGDACEFTPDSLSRVISRMIGRVDDREEFRGLS